MNQLDNICSEICSKIDYSIAVGVIDLENGMLLGLENKKKLEQSYFDNLAATILEIFSLNDIKKENKMSSKEVLINTNNNLVFAKQMDDMKNILFLISEKELNQGMGWSSLKLAAQDIKPLLT